MRVDRQSLVDLGLVAGTGEMRIISLRHSALHRGADPPICDIAAPQSGPEYAFDLSPPSEREA